MGIEQEAESVIDIVAPQIGVPLKIAKWAFFGIVGLLAVGAILWVGWKLFFAERAAEAKHDQVQTQAVIGKAQAGQDSAAQAVKITIDNGKAAVQIDAAVRSAINAIAQTKGADVQLDPALDDLGRRSICLRASAASLPDCQPVQPANP